jgi:hypothetical protein
MPSSQGPARAPAAAQKLRGQDQAADLHPPFQVPPLPWIQRIVIQPVTISNAIAEFARCAAGMPEWGWRTPQNWLVILAV